MTEVSGYITGKFGHSFQGLKISDPCLNQKVLKRSDFHYGPWEGYARGIFQFFDMDISTIQKQLDKLELGRILASTTK